MSKSRDTRKNFINDTKKGKFEDYTFHAIIKSSFNRSERTAILEKLPPSFKKIAYNLPFPDSHEEIRKHQAYILENRDLKAEISYYLEVFEVYKKEINLFIEINERLEKALLFNEYEVCFAILDEMDESIGFSYYSLLCEYYINEAKSDTEANKHLLQYLSQANADSKLMILMDLTRSRIDKNVSSLQFEGNIEQHRKLYDENTTPQYLDYIDFKFDYINFDQEIKNMAFIIGYDGDFSLIDRYQTLKNALPLILVDAKIESSFKESIVVDCLNATIGVVDTYWDNFRTLYGTSKGPYFDRSGYHSIQDLFMVGDYQKVIDICSHKLFSNPNYAELYLPFIQALIIEKRAPQEFFDKQSELHDILQLMVNVLQKRPSYNMDREKMLKKYYSIAHFNFSFHILEFVFNEYNLKITRPVQFISFLNSAVLRYNTFKLFKSQERLLNVLQVNEEYKTEAYLIDLIKGSSIEHPQSYLALKVRIGYLFKNKQYKTALDLLLEIDSNKEHPFLQTHFMLTWIKRNIIKCYIESDELGKAADVVVAYFFTKNYAFGHLVNSQIFDKLSNPFEDRFASHISIPIMFEIYHQPQASIYDTVANFLVANEVFIPSELIDRKDQWDAQHFNYFIEKCCIKENLEDSPFFNTINLLEEERIKLLNYLKKSNPEKIEVYNKEILKISQDTSLRKGLLQIHESRIYVDEKGIYKAQEEFLKELFGTYSTLSDGQIRMSGIRLGESREPNPINVAYYFIEPISDDNLEDYDLTYDYSLDPNAVSVPQIKYSYYLTIFNYLRSFFVFDEDYGFKSFLSMRIRHGTFSNVLRTVFEKFFLISSKESNSNIYQDIRYWDNKLENTDNLNSLQLLFKDFSSKIDTIIDDGLNWLVVNDEHSNTPAIFFDFEFSDEELYALFRNRVGRINELQEFTDEIFKILFERLEYCLDKLRKQIANSLTNSFVSVLEELQQEVTALKLTNSDHYLVEQAIVSCRTEIQSVIVQIESWFRISKNKYIEEFPIQLVLDTIVNYINSIYADALNNANLITQINCERNIKGKYFEAFGDVFINIFENIITKNKGIEKQLCIDIEIIEADDKIVIKVSNNLSSSIPREALEQSILDVTEKINNYQNGSDISFEKGSGYVKLCKSVAVDLERKEYSISPFFNQTPKSASDSWEVTIEFSNKDLFS